MFFFISGVPVAKSPAGLCHGTRPPGDGGDRCRCCPSVLAASIASHDTCPPLPSSCSSSKMSWFASLFALLLLMNREPGEGLCRTGGVAQAHVGAQSSRHAAEIENYKICQLKKGDIGGRVVCAQVKRGQRAALAWHRGRRRNAAHQSSGSFLCKSHGISKALL